MSNEEQNSTTEVDDFKRQNRHHNYTKKAIIDEKQHYEDYNAERYDMVKCPECKEVLEKDEEFMEYEAGSLWLLCECGNEIEVEE